MKRSVFINLLSSMLVTIILIIGVILVLAFTGTLDMQKQKLILSSASHTITYDGKKLTDNKWSLMEGTIKEGHKLAVNVTGSQTNVGMSENYISATITDESGEDVTDEYNIEYRPGALQVKARELVITAESDMKLYDGQPLTCNAYMLQSSVALLDTDRLEVSIEGSVTEVGEADNIITSAKVVSKKTGEDVSRNYHISSKSGKLVIYDESALVIKSKDAMKQYDPYTALVCYEYEIENGTLRPEHELRLTFTGIQLLPGWSDNTFDVRVVDKTTGADVTHMYDIYKRYGKLAVTNRQINIAGVTAKGTYGTMAFTGNYECEVGGLPEGYSLDMSDAFSGEIPAFGYGEVPSKIDTSRIKVLDTDGKDVTEYFDFIPEIAEGKLEVLSPNENPVDLFEVKTDSVGEIYLKQTSYGDYNIETKKWEEAPEYTKKSSLSPYYLPSAGLNLFSIKKADIKPLYNIFALPYYAAHKDYLGNTEVDIGENCLQKSDVFTEGDGENEYTVYYYNTNLSTTMNRTVPAALTEIESEYAAFVRENYLSVDEETKNFMLNEYAKEEWKQDIENGDEKQAIKPDEKIKK